MDCQNSVVDVAKEIKRLDGTPVRCGADRCDGPAFFLFIAAGTSGGRWAYCDEHARIRARQLETGTAQGGSDGGRRLLTQRALRPARTVVRDLSGMRY